MSSFGWDPNTEARSDHLERSIGEIWNLVVRHVDYVAQAHDMVRGAPIRLRGGLHGPFCDRPQVGAPLKKLEVDLGAFTRFKPEAVRLDTRRPKFYLVASWRARELRGARGVFR